MARTADKRGQHWRQRDSGGKRLAVSQSFLLLSRASIFRGFFVCVLMIKTKMLIP